MISLYDKADVDFVNMSAKFVLLEKSNDTNLDKFSIGDGDVNGICLHCIYRNSFEIHPRLPLALHPSKIR